MLIYFCMKKIFTGILASIVFLFVLVPSTYAKVLVQEKGTVTVSAKEIINDDLFIGAENVEILGTVNGDVYVGGGAVKIDGKINGDLLIAGGTITVSGKVKDDVYVGGGNVTVSKASIGDSLLVGSGTLTIDKDSTIGGSLLTGSGMLTNSAKVGRNFFAGAGSVSLDSLVGGEARIAAGEIKISDNTIISNDLYYMLGEDGKTELVLPQNTKVLGTIKKMEAPASMNPEINRSKEEFKNMFGYARGGMLLISFIGSLLVGVLVIKMYAKKAEELSNQVQESVFSNLGVGFLILVLTIPLALVVMFTIIGAQLSMITFALFGLAVYFAKLISALALGQAISKQFGWKKFNLYGSFLLGLALLFVFKFIPIVGGFTSFLFTCVGLGSIFKNAQNSI